MKTLLYFSVTINNSKYLLDQDGYSSNHVMTFLTTFFLIRTASDRRGTGRKEVTVPFVPVEGERKHG